MGSQSLLTLVVLSRHPTLLASLNDAALVLTSHVSAASLSEDIASRTISTVVSEQRAFVVCEPKVAWREWPRSEETDGMTGCLQCKLVVPKLSWVNGSSVR